MNIFSDKKSLPTEKKVTKMLIVVINKSLRSSKKATNMKIVVITSQSLEKK